MRILYIAPHPDTQNGIADYAAEFRWALENAQIQVEVLSPLSTRPHPNSVSQIIASLRRLRRLLASDHFNVIHCEIGGGLRREFWLALYCTIFSKIPVVLTVHDSPLLINNLFTIQRPGLLPRVWNALSMRVGKPIQFLLERTLLGRCKCVFCLSKMAADALERRFGINCVKHIPHGATIPSDSKRYRISGIMTVLYFGFIDIGKGIETLLKAISLLRQRKPAIPVRLVLAGDVSPFSHPTLVHAYREKIHATVHQLGLKKVTDVRGYTPKEQLRALFCEADVVVLPYRGSSTKSSSGVLMRSMSYGLATVASRARAFPEEIEHRVTGLLFETGNHVELADLLQELAESPTLMSELGRRARQHIEQEHAWPTVVEAVLRQYRRVLNWEERSNEGRT